MAKVAVIIGSTRQARFGDKPGAWILEHLNRNPKVEAKALDLVDYPMPFFDAPMPPGMPNRPPYGHEVVSKWTAEIAAADAFVIVTAEYNYGPPAVLKNAIDWVSREWNRKPVAFVSYGSAGGVRSVQQLREAAVELQMAPVRTAVHLPREVMTAYFTGGDVPGALAGSDAAATQMIADLLWWSDALKVARETGR